MDSEGAGGAEAYLRPRARLMSTLGEELISNERVALTELVKNAYDADASLVVIRFNAPLEEGAGSIEVWDDGHGMSSETVRGTWMEIATPYRHRRPRSEELGRRVLGAKGIGRFSAARLALVTSLATSRGDGQEVTLRLDWGRFSDEDAYLDQVPVNWSVRPPKVFSVGGEAEQLFDEIVAEFRTRAPARQDRNPHGTVVRLEGLRQHWGAESVETLKRSLSRLLPPPPPEELDVPDRPEFSIYIETPPGELRHYSGFVSASEALAHPHYRLVGTVDADGQAHLTLTAAGVDEELVIHEDLRQGTKFPTCGPVKLDIRTWDLDSGSLRKLLEIDLGARNISEVRRLIRGNSGVALYRDGFRIQPFGETRYDWLEFDQRRVNNPTMRFSNNQVAGFVYISADGNPGLRDRSHREGLIDSPEYEELRRVMLQAVSRLEAWRYKLRRPEPAQPPGGQLLTPTTEGGGHGVFQTFTLAPLRDVVNQRYPDDAVLGRALDEATEAINDSVQKVQEIISQFSRLATLGTLVDVVLHDGRAALTRIAYVLRRLNKLVKGTSEQDPDLSAALGKVHTDFSAQEKALDRLFTRVEPLSGRQRGRPRNISLHETIDEAVSVHEAELAKQGIAVTVGGEDVTVTAEPSDIAQVILNLVGNSIYWLSTLPEEADRSIIITTGRTPDGEVDIDVADSGPGVREEIKDLIFDTYFSDKPDGIGLGLSIAGSVVKDFYDGDLYLVSPGPLAGACFRARLRRRVG
ncbi:ATP-binding protein [Streptomyces sp. NPDC059832]|uniref:sensor histidine kinase n=1 Tax=Streptomyces sp. NPDC059832 TaxID=3346966 RepID=UPI003658CAEF